MSTNLCHTLPFNMASNQDIKGTIDDINTQLVSMRIHSRPDTPRKRNKPIPVNREAITSYDRQSDSLVTNVTNDNTTDIALNDYSVAIDGTTTGKQRLNRLAKGYESCLSPIVCGECHQWAANSGAHK